MIVLPHWVHAVAHWPRVTLKMVVMRSALGLPDLAVRAVAGEVLPRSAPVQGVSRPPHTADGSPLARANPCAPAPEYGVRSHEKRDKAGERCNEVRNGTRISASDPTRSAASRAVMAGWAGEGGGRFGERREYEAPTLPRTPRQHGMARHHNSQARNSTLCQHGAARHHTRQPRNSSPSRHATTTATQEAIAPPHTHQPPGNDSTQTLAWST